MMFASRSAGIVDCVWVTGIVLPARSTLPLVPGSHSTKYSPISDCGRDWQNASERKDPRPGWLTCTVTSAWHFDTFPLMQPGGRSMLLIVPALTPATLKSTPLVSPNALSSSTL